MSVRSVADVDALVQRYRSWVRDEALSASVDLAAAQPPPQSQPPPSLPSQSPTTRKHFAAPNSRRGSDSGTIPTPSVTIPDPFPSSTPPHNAASPALRSRTGGLQSGGGLTGPGSGPTAHEGGLGEFVPQHLANPPPPTASSARYSPMRMMLPPILEQPEVAAQQQQQQQQQQQKQQQYQNQSQNQQIGRASSKSTLLENNPSAYRASSLESLASLPGTSQSNASVRVRLAKRLSVGAAQSALPPYFARNEPPLAPPIPYLRKKKEPRLQKKFEPDLLGMSISRYIQMQSGEGRPKDESDPINVSSLKQKRSVNAPSQPTQSSRQVPQIKAQFEPLELSNLPSSLNRDDFLKFLKKQQYRREQEQQASVAAGLGRAVNLFGSIGDLRPDENAAEAAAVSQGREELSLGPESNENLPEVHAKHIDPSGRPSSPFHWTIPESHFVHSPARFTAPTLKALQSREFAAREHRLMEDSGPFVTDAADQLDDEETWLETAKEAFKCLPDMRESLAIMTPEGHPRGTELDDSQSRLPTALPSSNPPPPTADRPVQIVQPANKTLNDSLQSSMTSQTASQSFRPTVAATGGLFRPGSRIGTVDGSRSQLNSHGGVDRASNFVMGPRAFVIKQHGRLGSGIKQSIQESIGSDSMSSLMDDEKNFNTIEDTSEQEEAQQYTHPYSMDYVIEEVLNWPGHFDIISLTMPKEEELYDDAGQIIDHPALHNVENAFLADPALPNNDICFDIWNRLESIHEDNRVTLLFWMARAGHLEEVLQRITQDPISTVPLPLLFLLAQVYVCVGKLEEALHAVDSYISRDRHCAQVWSLKGRIHHIMGPTKIAINCYTHAIKLIPKLWRFHYERGVQYDNLKEYMYAFEDFKVVRQLNKDCIDAVWRHVNYYMEKDLFEDAFKTLEVILDRQPGNHRAIFLSGKIMAQLHNYTKSFTDFCEAIRLEPNVAEYYLERGCLLRETDPNKALEDFSVSLLIDDSAANVDALLYRGHVYFNVQRYELAHCDWVRVSELKSTAYLNLNLGILCMQHLDDLVQAMQFLDIAIDQDPLMVKTYLCRAELFQLLHQESFLVTGTIMRKLRKKNAGEVNFLDRAVREYSRAIRLYPTNFILYLYRGRVLLRQKKFSMGMHDFHTAFELNSSIAQTFLQRALILSFQGKYQQIVDEFQDQRRFGHRFDSNLLVLVAKAKMRTGDAVGALAVLSESPSYNQEPQIHIHKGLCYQSLKQYPQACQEFTKCIEMSPRFAKAFYHRGLCKILNDDPTGLQDLNEAIRYDPKMFDAYMSRATYFQSIGRYSEGVDDCTAAIRLEPASVRGYLLRGQLLCLQHQYMNSLADFTRTIEIERDCFTAYFNRAVSLHHAGEYEGALRDYSIALLLKDNDMATRRSRGCLYWQLGQYHSALCDLEAARNYDDVESNLFELLGMAYFKVGRVKNAQQVFTQMILAHPENVTGYLARANISAQTGAYEAAIKDYARCLHTNPRCVEALVNLGYVMQMSGRHKRAWEHFTAALTLDTACTAALEGRAVIHVAKGNNFAALLDISQAVLLMPNDAHVLVNRGVIHQCFGDSTSALMDYKRAIEIDDKSAVAHFNAANLYFQQLSWDVAKQHYDAALALLPTDSRILLNRALTLLRLNGMLFTLQKLHYYIVLNLEWALANLDIEGAKLDLAKAQENCLDSTQEARAAYHLACLHRKEKNYTRAEELLNFVIQTVPQSVEAWVKRAEIRGHLGNMTAALQDYAHAITLDPSLEQYL